MENTIYRIIIAGGRDFDDYQMLRKEALDAIRRVFTKVDKNNTYIVSGRAKGADSLGERFADEFGLNKVEFPANWDKYGKSAGFRRNEQMADFAKGKNEENQENIKGLLIAFWDGKSHGTKHMIELAKNKKMPVEIIRY